MPAGRLDSRSPSASPWPSRRCRTAVRVPGPRRATEQAGSVTVAGWRREDAAGAHQRATRRRKEIHYSSLEGRREAEEVVEICTGLAKLRCQPDQQWVIALEEWGAVPQQLRKRIGLR